MTNVHQNTSSRIQTISKMLLLCLWSAVAANAQPWLVRGRVVDQISGQPLPTATIQLQGTYQGTIANDEGEYSLEVRHLPVLLQVSYIGYASGQKRVVAVDNRVDFALAPVPFQFDPVVVTAEDPAERIMRQVIRRKGEWRPRLASYKAQAYTRRVLENDEGIVMIGEMASEIYWDRQRGMREVVQSRRLTQNLDAQNEYISALEGFVNFYDDIPFVEHRLIGPTHPDALAHYSFRLLGQRYLDDQVVYDIGVEPKNKLQAAFVGRLAVLDGDFVLLEIELAPNRASVTSAIPLPIIESMDFAYRQQFRLYGEVWLPVDYHASMEVKIGTLGLHFLLAKFNSLSQLGFSPASSIWKPMEKDENPTGVRQAKNRGDWAGCRQATRCATIGWKGRMPV
ncbi:MAG: hypothetical protein GKR89_00350 [Candidatus Latescibacteria bacterium]|nr:hypothetical protein [Candidatus Latescibacterota bacterium]